MMGDVFEERVRAGAGEMLFNKSHPTFGWYLIEIRPIFV
jgi:hypothetical protein